MKPKLGYYLVRLNDFRIVEGPSQWAAEMWDVRNNYDDKKELTVIYMADMGHSYLVD